MAMLRCSFYGSVRTESVSGSVTVSVALRERRHAETGRPSFETEAASEEVFTMIVKGFSERWDERCGELKLFWLMVAPFSLSPCASTAATS